MALKKSNITILKAISLSLGLLTILAVLFTAASQRVSTDSQAAFPIRPPKPTPTPTILPTKALTFYLKTSEYINASPGIASTVVSGCNVGDIAVSSGLDDYSGPINVWRTVRSTPSSTDMHGFVVTVINEDSVVHSFTVTTKCLKNN